MADLYIHGDQNPVESVFQLIGTQENAITFSLGWILSRCPSFLKKLYEVVLPDGHFNLEDARVILQGFDSADQGFTDVEVHTSNSYFIVEAKRGWVLPEQQQMERYQHRLEESTKAHRAFVVLSEVLPGHALSKLPDCLGHIPVKYYDWRTVSTLAQTGTRKPKERELLRQFRVYLKGVLPMQDQDSNRVYVVSLNRKCHADSKITYIDIVKKKGCYFHPVGHGYPKVPLNYLGFRYDGKLQHIHHVESWDEVEDLHDGIREIPSKKIQPHYLYRLGPAIVPSKDVKNGSSVQRAARRWAMLDLLLTSNTISEAVELTKQREQKEE